MEKPDKEKVFGQGLRTFMFSNENASKKDFCFNTTDQLGRSAFSKEVRKCLFVSPARASSYAEYWGENIWVYFFI